MWETLSRKENKDKTKGEAAMDNWVVKEKGRKKGGGRNLQNKKQSHKIRELDSPKPSIVTKTNLQTELIYLDFARLTEEGAVKLGIL